MHAGGPKQRTKARVPRRGAALVGAGPSIDGPAATRGPSTPNGAAGEVEPSFTARAPATAAAPPTGVGLVQGHSQPTSLAGTAILQVSQQVSRPQQQPHSQQPQPQPQQKLLLLQKQPQGPKQPSPTWSPRPQQASPSQGLPLQGPSKRAGESKPLADLGATMGAGTPGVGAAPPGRIQEPTAMGASYSPAAPFPAEAWAAGHGGTTGEG